MIDPINFTNFNRTDLELEETMLFAVLVAGKNALTTAKLLNNLLIECHFIKKMPWQPFNCLRQYSEQEIIQLLKNNRFGCYLLKGKSFYKLINSNINLRECSIEDLEKIPGIGPKTSRFFLLHTRKNMKIAVLDTHILKYLKDQGIDVPKSTPSKGKYKVLEQEFLELAKKSKKSIAEFDLAIWNQYRGKK